MVKSIPPVQVVVPLAGSIPTSVMGYSKLIAFEQSCALHYDCLVQVDLSNLVWIDANLSALFEAILYRLFQKNRLTFDIDVETVKQRFPILLRNGFLSYLHPLPDQAGTTVPIGTFQPAEVVEFATYIDDRLLSHPSLRLGNERMYNIRKHFLELFANIELHAQTSLPIFACGQYYPKSYKLKFTLVDLGIGYLPPIQSFTKGAIKSSSTAITWALADHNTTKVATTPGGLGLKELLSYCQEDAGELHISTGDAYWASTSTMNPPTLATVLPFAGTVISVGFNCQ
jgi:hypothetical protein